MQSDRRHRCGLSWISHFQDLQAYIYRLIHSASVCMHILSDQAGRSRQWWRSWWFLSFQKYWRRCKGFNISATTSFLILLLYRTSLISMWEHGTFKPSTLLPFYNIFPDQQIIFSRIFFFIDILFLLQLLCFYFVLTTFTTVGYGKSVNQSMCQCQRSKLANIWMWSRWYFCYNCRRTGWFTMCILFFMIKRIANQDSLLSSLYPKLSCSLETPSEQKAQSSLFLLLLTDTYPIFTHSPST